MAIAQIKNLQRRLGLLEEEAAGGGEPGLRP
jgi:hypothetical protein